MIDTKCVRALLLVLDETLSPTRFGKRQKNVQLRKIVGVGTLSRYKNEEVYQAAQYIVQKGFAELTKESRSAAPKWFVFTGVTAKGQEYIPFIKTSPVWEKLSGLFTNIFEVSAVDLLSAAVKHGLQAWIAT